MKNFITVSSALIAALTFSAPLAAAHPTNSIHVDANSAVNQLASQAASDISLQKLMQAQISKVREGKIVWQESYQFTRATQ